ncbi:unnamed protein product [Prorocentrum cordatum]|uniref:Uncharacterized protein n=1 Tax=Prorocentrum cordatum TaxID=2364126 RepID=A0ABN9X2W7_9DINO|nr:unnamed protein product [Polarella glacialis]
MQFEEKDHIVLLGIILDHEWQDDGVRFRLVVDCQVLAGLVNGATPLLDESFRPPLRRVVSSLDRLLQRGPRRLGTGAIQFVGGIARGIDRRIGLQIARWTPGRRSIGRPRISPRLHKGRMYLYFPMVGSVVALVELLQALPPTCVMRGLVAPDWWPSRAAHSRISTVHFRQKSLGSKWL